jgi:hypothetical protein
MGLTRERRNFWSGATLLRDGAWRRSKALNLDFSPYHTFSWYRYCTTHSPQAIGCMRRHRHLRWRVAGNSVHIPYGQPSFRYSQREVPTYDIAARDIVTTSRAQHYPAPPWIFDRFTRAAGPTLELCLNTCGQNHAIEEKPQSPPPPGIRKNAVISVYEKNHGVPGPFRIFCL